MLTRRETVALIGAGALAPTLVRAQDAKEKGGRNVFDHGVVIERARQLSLQPYKEPEAKLPEAFDRLSFDDFRAVRFKRDRAYFGNSKSGFRMELFHRGFLYKKPVVVNLVRDGVPAPIPYDPSFFDFGPTKPPGRLPIDFGFAGIRILYPLNRPSVMDELAVFLGASYYRFLGMGQHYGISARGVSVNTGESTPEEFPDFRELWIEEPAPGAVEIVVHGLLDGPSLTGAYRFVITPGEETTCAVGSTLFPRVDVPKLGVAPLTSMFFYGENDREHYRGFRPEVHDSDGLLVRTSSGEWTWRPLMNPKALLKTVFPEPAVQAYGLLQRDRLFEHYQDLEVRYDLRPSYWIERQGDWGPGRVELVEIPTDNETFDNVVAYWTPDVAPKAGETVRHSYVIRSLKLAERLTPKARAIHTFVTEARASGDPNPGASDIRRFIVDFEGGDLDYWLDEPKRVVTDTGATAGKIEAAYVVPNREIGGFRLFLDHRLEEAGAEAQLRAVLRVGDRPVTETWVFSWKREG
ncbi:MAG: glucan biosynthesis protein G [Ancylobacter novellus]|uniref:Glucan biosynthesis protein G n=1 Tax=Ancylobacter novellus TaxID=921 RepID=A0A2W5KHR1_ANCNO|nr:MAG: glucan biosynthesis protein G [Ancylobacter novellus]